MRIFLRVCDKSAATKFAELERFDKRRIFLRYCDTSAAKTYADLGRFDSLNYLPLYFYMSICGYRSSPCGVPTTQVDFSNVLVHVKQSGSNTP